jgi:hypothetical protein
MTKHADNSALETWITLNAVIKDLGEQECLRLLDVERCGRNRPTFVLRLHSRLNRLRRARERAQLTRGA